MVKSVSTFLYEQGGCIKELNIVIELLINLAFTHGFLESNAASCPIPHGKAGCALADVHGDLGHFMPHKKISGVNVLCLKAPADPVTCLLGCSRRRTYFVKRA